MNVGAVGLTERFGLDGPVSTGMLAEVADAIGSDSRSSTVGHTPTKLVALGGVVTNLAAVMHALASYDPDVVQGTTLDQTEIDRQIELYRGRTADERRGIIGLQPGRAEVVLAGARIVRTTMEKLGCDSLVVSDRGLRHGVLLERFDNPPACPAHPEEDEAYDTARATLPGGARPGPTTITTPRGAGTALPVTVFARARARDR